MCMGCICKGSASVKVYVLDVNKGCISHPGTYCVTQIVIVELKM
jgi:hypothetical protein